MTTLLILSGFYIIWLAALLTVAYPPLVPQLHLV